MKYLSSQEDSFDLHYAGVKQYFSIGPFQILFYLFSLHLKWEINLFLDVLGIYAMLMELIGFLIFTSDKHHYDGFYLFDICFLQVIQRA